MATSFSRYLLNGEYSPQERNRKSWFEVLATYFSRSLLNGESTAANVDQAMDPRTSASNGRHSNSRPRPRTGVLDLQGTGLEAETRVSANACTLGVPGLGEGSYRVACHRVGARVMEG
ncbi:hypothetical protein RJ639_011866 [Escallonia herrerae]|uniref:Uncharacterized protein n=1 Tax=Escallonia herrerae TaxID=1293975 RepID=A0AA89APD0_9ASTE|nr:hypothetical protein RJ639_011866 [Escallonia herrerae]